MLLAAPVMAEEYEIFVSTPITNISTVVSLKIDWTSDLNSMLALGHKNRIYEFGFRSDGVVVWRIKNDPAKDQH
jgi:hypothetical protein